MMRKVFGVTLAYVLLAGQACVGKVLDPGIKVLGIREENGHMTLDEWSPSDGERETAGNSYLDQDNLAAPNVRHEDVNGTNEYPSENRLDYIDLGRELTYSSAKQRTNSGPSVIETLIVVDKEFGDLFQHDRVRILNYLTVYFWDVNLRYKTLPSVDISFRITGVIIISTPSGQPFIEEARAADGRAEFNRILYKFVDWVDARKNSFPKFDIAVAITNTALEWGGGLAFVSAACSKFGAGVFNDAGDWRSTTSAVGAHEMAHIVGAPHDESIPGCNADGYIMSGGNDQLKWYFSPCSNKAISDFVRSDQAACVRRIDEAGQNPINPSFSAVLTPTMAEQCQKHFGPQAWVEEHDTVNCVSIRCVYPRNGGLWIQWIPTTENSPCLGGGRCFRGRCRKQGSLIQNVGSGLCMASADRFNFYVAVKLITCPQPGTPLDRFVISDTNLGKTLATPWSSTDSTETGDKCAFTGNAEGNPIYTDRCSGDNPWHGWDFINVSNGEFLISHRITKRCARRNNDIITTHQNCDRNDANMRWRIL